MKKISIFFSAFVLVLLILPFGDVIRAEESIPAEKTPEDVLYYSFTNTCSDWNGENKYCDIVIEASDSETAFEKVRDVYHSDTNAYLNSTIAKISGTTFRCDIKRDITALETNMEAIYFKRKIELFKYHAALERLKIRGTNEPAKAVSTEERLNSSYTFAVRIQNEYEISEKVLRIAIKSYSEMRLYYPLHQELQCLAYDLSGLRDSWQFLVDQVARMPAKFVNASAQFK